jgi:hypothetical protein
VKALRKTCRETLSEEFNDDSMKIKWIGIEWWNQLHEMDTVDERMKVATLPTWYCLLIQLGDAANYQ